MVPAIEVHNLKKTFRIKTEKKWFKQIIAPSYGQVTAIKNLTFSINTGEQVALLGPNGSGKSTTLKILSGLLAPTEGTIKIFNYDPIREAQNIRPHIAAFFGNKSSLWPRLSVRESLEYVRIVYDIDRDVFKSRLDSLVKLFELEPLLSRTPNSLSLGQRMRCELVRKLLPSPKILLLDEPTIGMDIVSKAKFRELIKQYAAIEKTTLLLTSHDTSDIEHLCQRVIVIKEGEKLFDGSFENLHSTHAKSENDRLESVLVNMFTQGAHNATI